MNKAIDRPFFLTAAGVAALVAFAGFARTYYLKGLFGTPEVSSLLHLHGVVMTLWVLLFVTQVGLVRADRTDLHRRLGVAGAILALAVVGLGAVTAIDAARRGAPAGPPPLVFLAITLSVLVVFAVLVVAGLVLRRRSDYHKRLMMLATLTVIQPAISRLAIDATGIFHPLLFFGITIVMLVAFIAWDWARNRRLHPAFAWGMLFFLVSLPVRFVIAGSGPWQDVARWLTAG